MVCGDKEGYFFWPSFILSRVGFVLTHLTCVYLLLFVLNDPFNLLPKTMPLMDVRAEDLQPESVCTSIDKGAAVSNGCWFAAWWLMHSLPARRFIKVYVLRTQNEKGIHPIDRPLFACQAPIMWFLTMYKWRPISNCARFDPAAVPCAVWMLSGTVISAALVLVMSLQYMLPEHVFGTDRHLFRQGEYPHGKLITSYPYGLVAHPAAAGFLWMWWALPAYTANHLQLISMWTLFIHVGTMLEEGGLKGEGEFGNQYEKYRSKVSAFFPTWWSIRNTLGLPNEELKLE